MSFDPSDHLTQLKSKQGSQDYLEVKWRLVWFRSKYPNGTIDTEEVEVDLDRIVEAEAYVWNAEKRRSEKVIKQAKGYARFRTVATNGEGGRATGTKSESAADFPDFIEKAETGSIGRALAALGFGTQFTGDELSEGHRIVDSPVDSQPPNEAAATDGNTAPISEVNKLRTRWGKAYNVKDGDFEERWTRYKVYLLSKDVADPDLDTFQIARINGDLVKEERKAADTSKKAS